MDLRSIVMYLSMKDMNAKEIYADMNDILGADCIGYSTITKYLREENFSKSMLDKDFEPKIDEDNFINKVILGALKKCSFSSIPKIAKRILIPMSTVQCHLVNSLGYQIRKIRSVPHSLSLNQKQAPVEMNQDLLQVLRLALHHAWKYIVPLEGAWFYCSNDFDRPWFPHDELPPSFPKQTGASQKLMITVIWNPYGFHAIQSLPKEIK
jgi:hypothetical protein